MMSMNTFLTALYGALSLTLLALLYRPLVRQFIIRRGTAAMGQVVRMTTERGIYVERGSVQREALVIVVHYTKEDGTTHVGVARELRVHLDTALIRPGHPVGIRYHPFFRRTIVLDPTSFRAAHERQTATAPKQMTVLSKTTRSSR